MRRELYASTYRLESIHVHRLIRVNLAVHGALKGIKREAVDEALLGALRDLLGISLHRFGTSVESFNAAIGAQRIGVVRYALSRIVLPGVGFHDDPFPLSIDWFLTDAGLVILGKGVVLWVGDFIQSFH